MVGEGVCERSLPLPDVEGTDAGSGEGVRSVEECVMHEMWKTLTATEAMEVRMALDTRVKYLRKMIAASPHPFGQEMWQELLDSCERVMKSLGVEEF